MTGKKMLLNATPLFRPSKESPRYQQSPRARLEIKSQHYRSSDGFKSFMFYFSNSHKRKKERNTKDTKKGKRK